MKFKEILNEIRMNEAVKPIIRSDERTAERADTTKASVKKALPKIQAALSAKLGYNVKLRRDGSQNWTWLSKLSSSMKLPASVKHSDEKGMINDIMDVAGGSDVKLTVTFNYFTRYNTIAALVGVASYIHASSALYIVNYSMTDDKAVVFDVPRVGGDLNNMFLM